MSYITFEGSLVRKNALKEGKNGSKFIHLSVARNYRELNEQTKEWEDAGTIFQEVVLFGKLAENFEASNVQLGTRLIISGRLTVSPARSYVNKEGVTIEVPASESVVADYIGISFSAWQQPVLLEREGKKSSPKPAQPAVQQVHPAEERPVAEDLFSDEDLFADDSFDDGFDFFNDL